jgi:prepilin-type N-terminal cleavage/methylation domain-containing protein
MESGEPEQSNADRVADSQPGEAGMKLSVRGFTLMEMLLAMTLFSIAASSSYGIFSMGIQIWKRTKASSQAEHKALLALERIGKDVRKTINSAPRQELMKEVFKYQGKSMEVNLPASPYRRITYRWENAKKEVCRSEENATDLYQKKMPPCKTLVKGIQSFKLRYWLYDGIAKSYSWYDEWKHEEGMPAAIQVEMTLQPAKERGQREAPPAKRFARTFLVPIGQTSASFGELSGL